MHCQAAAQSCQGSTGTSSVRPNDSGYGNVRFSRAMRDRRQDGRRWKLDSSNNHATGMALSLQMYA